MKKIIPFFLFLFFWQSAAAFDAIRNLPAKYAKSFSAYVDFTGIANNHALFRIHTFFDLENMCDISGQAFLEEPFRANFKNDDCTLIFDFKENYSAVQISSKFCQKTCNGKVRNLVNGLYQRQ